MCGKTSHSSPFKSWLLLIRERSLFSVSNLPFGSVLRISCITIFFSTGCRTVWWQKRCRVSGVQVAPTILIVRTIDSIGHTTVHWDEGPVRPFYTWAEVAMHSIGVVAILVLILAVAEHSIEYLLLRVNAYSSKYFQG